MTEPRPWRPWTSAAVAACWVAAAVFVVLWVIAGRVVAPISVVTLITLVALVPLALGTVIARGAPGNPAGPLIAAAGSFLLATNVPGDSLPDVLEGAWMLLYLPFAIVLLIVPDGRAASPRWRRAGWAITLDVALFIVIGAVQALAEPGVADALQAPSLVLLFVFMALLIVCACAPIARYRHAGPEARLRLRWVFVAGISLPMTLLLCWASYLLIGGPDLVGIGLALMYLAIPAGVAAALVRPALFDIDRAAVITATAAALAFAVLSALSAATAIVGVALVDWSPIAAVTTTGTLAAAAAIAFPALRRAFDRLLYPERGRGIAALRRLTADVETGAASAETVEEVLRDALRDEQLIVAYRTVGDRALIRLDGTALGSPPGHAAAVRWHGDEIGVIVPGPSRVKPPPSAVVHAAAGLIDAARTRAELARARSEVEASRARLLRTGYEERRRLERDLHDGAQQRLVALGMRLRVLQRTAATDDAVVAGLDAAVAELGTAVAELRRLAHGVRPSALDDGLAAALAALAQQVPTNVELDVDTADLPDAVATTAYFVVSEAVVNALKHADAANVQVTVHRDPSALRVRIRDDGRGGAAAQSAGGLTGLADRVEALGGDLRIDSPRGAGTTIEATLPCAS